jgi:hypothetical protein
MNFRRYSYEKEKNVIKTANKHHKAKKLFKREQASQGQETQAIQEGE